MTDLPFTVLAGYLGAGKTTLLNRLLTESHGQRLAVLVNDFGSVDVDASLIAAHDGTTLSMANGCACCTIGDDLGAAIVQVRDLGTFDRIVLEASGVADPRRLAEWATLPGLALGGIIVLADACTVAARAADRYVGDVVRSQLAAADVLVLTKTDLTDEPTRAEAAAVLRASNPTAEVVHSAHGDGFAILLGAHRHTDDHVHRNHGSDATPTDARHTDARHTDAHHADAPASEVHETTTVPGDLPCDRTTLAAVLAAAPGLVRAKGIIRCRTAGDDTTGTETVLVQAAGRVTIQSLPEGSATTGLVLIGIAGVADLPAIVRALHADGA